MRMTAMNNEPQVTRRPARLGRWSAITIGIAILIDIGLDAAYLMGLLP